VALVVFFICISSYYFSFKVVSRQGSNNKAEMCTLFVLLNLAMDKGVSSIQIMGDLKLVIG